MSEPHPTTLAALDKPDAEPDTTSADTPTTPATPGARRGRSKPPLSGARRARGPSPPCSQVADVGEGTRHHVPVGPLDQAR